MWGRVASHDDTEKPGSDAASPYLPALPPRGLAYGVTPYGMAGQLTKIFLRGRFASQDDAESPGSGGASLALATSSIVLVLVISSSLSFSIFVAAKKKTERRARA